MRTVMRFLVGGILALCALPAAADDFISLPPAQTVGGKPLMEALRDRRTTRELRARQGITFTACVSDWDG